MKTFTYPITLLITIFLTTAINCFGQLPDVLICGSPNTPAWSNDVQSKLLGTGQFSAVTIFDITSGTPTVEQLQTYDAVLLYTDSPPLENSTLLGDNLATYIDGGGGVVSAVFATASIPIGGNFNTETYQVMLPASQTQGSTQTLGTVWEPNHPIMQGVSSFNGGLSSYRSTSTTLTPGGYRVADWNDGLFLITAKSNVGLSQANRVDLGFFPPSSDAQSDFWLASSNGALIMANSLTWVAGGGATCSVPVNLSVDNITATSAKLKWNAVNGAVGYQVAYKIVGTSQWTTVHAVTNVKKISGLTDNTKYFWKVKTVCSVSPLITSAGSSKESFTTSELRMADESLQQLSFQIYPNPAEEQATIYFTLPQSSHVSMKVYDMSGKEIACPVSGVNLPNDMEAGGHSLQLNTSQFAKGVYLVKIIADDEITNQKLIIQ